jgi:hypothetical protein
LAILSGSLTGVAAIFWGSLESNIKYKNEARVFLGVMWTFMALTVAVGLLMGILWVVQP